MSAERANCLNHSGHEERINFLEDGMKQIKVMFWAIIMLGLSNLAAMSSLLLKARLSL
jgi:hypothetical protein